MMKIVQLILGMLITYSVCYSQLRVGAECTEDYLDQIQGKKIAVVANHTSMVKNEHLVDMLIRNKVTIVKIFTPEHGFRGKADAGEAVTNSVDPKTNIPIISLYGDKKKPSVADMQGIEIVVFDMQDVGARFYTYISTMHNVMEACAENGIDFWVLDRPNPNGFYVDGPVLNMQYKSFIGMHPVPIVHGMTVAEYARMIQGEKWLAGGIQCKLHYVMCDGYTHKMKYIPPIAPSPNLPNITSIYLYPVLCLTEGTVLSCGRGTDFPFQVVGHPKYKQTQFSFTPRSIEGASKNPPHKNVLCYGTDLRKYPVNTITQLPLDIFIDAYKNYNGTEPFFTPFFLKVAGTAELQKQIEQGMTAQQIRNSWKQDLETFMKIRKKYLLYADF
jgi:uncharacterized protein YbbC (DUF1343 family)